MATELKVGDILYSVNRKTSGLNRLKIVKIDSRYAFTESGTWVDKALTYTAKGYVTYLKVGGTSTQIHLETPELKAKYERQLEEEVFLETINKFSMLKPWKLSDGQMKEITNKMNEILNQFT